MRALCARCKEAGFKAELRLGDPEDPIPAMLILQDVFENTAELSAGLRGLDPESFARTITVPFQGQSVQVIGLEDFIAMKCFAGGPQDISDAQSSLKNHDAPIDVDLLRRLTRRFGRAASDVLEQLLSSSRSIR